MTAHSAFRSAARVVAAALALVLVLVGGGLAWLGTQHGLEWISQQAVVWSEGRLVLGDVKGSIYRRITLSRATFKDATMVLDARNVTLQWRPQALLYREAYISQLAIGDLHITTAKTDPAKPLQIPASLRLPLNATLADARVQRIEIANVGAVSDLHFRMRARAQTHELEISNIAALGARAIGTLQLDTAAPFVASGKFALDGKLLGESIKASLTVGGNLNVLQLEASTAVRGAPAKATGFLRPFSALPLEHFALDATNVDLAVFDKTLPHTKISLAFAAGMRAQDRFAGTLRASNDTSGPIDTQRLPLTRAGLAFAGRGTRWTFSEIDLGIGKSGHARGSGAINGANVRMQLSVTQIDPATLHRRLKPLVVSGQATLSGDAGAQKVDASLTGGGVKLELVARHAQKIITVERGTLRAEAARLDFTGRAALTEKRQFNIDATFDNLDPARFVNTPPARLNGKVSAQGALAPAWETHVNLSVERSSLRGQPLRANAAFTTGEAQWFNGDARAVLGGNRLDVTGRFGQPDDTLRWSLDAPNLKIISKTLAGNVKGHGTFAGSFDKPSLEFNLSARNFATGELAANSIDAQGLVKAGTDGALRLTMRIAGARSGAIALDEMKVAAQGTRLQHDINTTLRGAKFDVALNALGGLDNLWRWNGSVSTLEARGQLPLRLTAPARLSVGRDLLEIDGLQAATLDGQLGPASARIGRGHITTRGAFTGITAKSLLSHFPQTVIDPQDATFGGRWDFALHETMSGSAEIQLEKGDLGVRAGPTLAFGLRQLKLNLTAQDNRLEATFDGRSASLGTITARVRTRIERRDAAWVLTKNAPLDGNLLLDLQSLSWVRVLAPNIDQISGRAAARFRLAGTLDRPLVSGDVSADALRLRAIGLGLSLTDGTLRASLDGKKLKIDKLSVKAGDGTIEADGLADLTGGLRSLEIAVRATRARILSSPQLTVVLSGSGRTGLSDLKLALDGKFKIEEGRYDLGSERRPVLGDDVFVVGQTRVADPGAKPLRVLIDVTIDLNDKFAIRGHGLDAILGGSLRTTTRNGTLQGFGTIHTLRGEYFAFGQELKVERGRLNFAGPLNNPGLDLRAGRKIKTVEVGVEVSGSLQRPVVTLASEPAMPDSERLGWLVLGRDPQTANATELALLQAASLLSGDRHAKPLQRQIAEGLGLDQLGFSRGTDGTLGVLAMGKRITEQLTVRLEQTLGGTAGGLLKIEYLLSRRWRLEGTTGAENAADIFFALRFD